MTYLRSLVLVLLPCAGAPALAQTLSATYYGDVPGGRFGERFDVVGDLDGDGRPEIVIGYPDDDTAAPDAGRAVVLSTGDGSILFTWLGDQAGDRLGTSVSDGGDVDADGVPDVLVGSPTDNGGRGALHVFSGATGERIHYQRGLVVGDEFAYDVEAIGDIDGDAHGDYAVGVPGRFVQFLGQDAGEVYVYSGATGERVHVLSNPAFDQNRFGTHLSRVGDVDGDGRDDVLASGPFGWYDPGVVGIHSGATGALLRVHLGLDHGHGFAERIGHGVAGVGDVDGDGRGDYVFTHMFPGSSMRLLLISGATGQQVMEFSSGMPAFTSEVPIVLLGDVDGFPGPELAVATTAPEVRVCSLASGAVLQSITGPSSFGAGIAAIGDHDGDGLADVAVGFPGDDTAGTDAGSIGVWSGNPCGPGEIYCVGAPNSQGEGARIRYAGSSSLSSGRLSLYADGCPPSQVGLFYYAPNAIQIPFGDGFRCAGGAFWRLALTPTDESGTAEHAVDYADLPVPIEAGSTWRFQFLYRDPGGPLGTGFNGSDGLALAFCP